ncbi:MAG TPA: histidine kinase [Streptosporangiaceae bacterium]
MLTSDLPPGYPFQGPGLLARAAPFAVVAVLAEASLALPPGPVSLGAVVASAVLLAAVLAAVALPWSRLPAWLPVLVPLAYTGSVLALNLAAGTTSGVGIVILIPLIWTALFHERWESAVIVAAIVATEVIISLTPTVVPAAVLTRRVLLWTALGALISVAAHGLRDRIRRAQHKQAALQNQLRQHTVLADRDRIAADLQDKVIQKVFAAGLTLQSAATLTTEPEVRSRVQASMDDLDGVLRMLRETVFGLARQRRPDSAAHPGAPLP